MTVTATEEKTESPEDKPDQGSSKKVSNEVVTLKRPLYRQDMLNQATKAVVRA